MSKTNVRPQGDKGIRPDRSANFHARSAKIHIDDAAILHRGREQTQWQRAGLRPANGFQAGKPAFVVGDDQIDNVSRAIEALY
jgi:hypothetical protein